MTVQILKDYIGLLIIHGQWQTEMYPLLYWKMVLHVHNDLVIIMGLHEYMYMYLVIIMVLYMYIMI